ncbi:MAG: hypothetical protein MN733_20920 [Nitrososphaera sp.]|nr:hypothetical protein [Nitrososphaera sp.]
MKKARALFFALISCMAANSVLAQGKWVLKGGKWVSEAIVQDQVLRKGIYPAGKNYVVPGVRNIVRYGASDPMYGTGNSTPQVYGRPNCRDPRSGMYYPC